MRRRLESEERGRGARVSSLKVRKAVLHDRTEDADADAIEGERNRRERGKRLRRSFSRHGGCDRKRERSAKVKDKELRKHLVCADRAVPGSGSASGSG